MYSSERARVLAFAEPATVFLLIMLYIWWLRYAAWYTCFAIVGFVVFTHLVRREDPQWLGFRSANFKECGELLGPAVLLIALLLLGGGFLFGTMRPIPLERALGGLCLYCVWGLFQQYLLNGYLANRLLAISPVQRVPLIAALVFAGTHLPNWFLMAVTFVMGYLSTLIFLRYRNVYVLGLAHGLIGTLLYVVIPDSISHHLSVGPGFFVH